MNRRNFIQITAATLATLGVSPVAAKIPYDGSIRSTVFSDLYGLVPAKTGDKVARWHSIDGSKPPLIQPDPEKRSTYALSADGSNYILDHSLEAFRPITDYIEVVTTSNKRGLVRTELMLDEDWDKLYDFHMVGEITTVRPPTWEINGTLDIPNYW